MSTLRGQTIVITGASSGIGREAAIQFARKGCRVVVAARRLDALAETVRICRGEGAEAVFQVTDVTDEAQVQALADFAIERFGRIDAWINNAGVTLFGLLEKTPFDEHRRVFETNVYGAMYGARAMLPILRAQRRGVIVNIGSILSKVGQAYVPSYVVSKFALRGLSETLRVEMADHPEVHVCTLMPYTVDTPHFESGANHVGRDARALQPIQSPEVVAAALVDLVQHPRRELHVPRYAVLGLWLHELAPRTVERLLLDALREHHFGVQREADSEGTLFASHDAGAVHGHRRPLVGTARFFGWVFRQLFLMKQKQPPAPQVSAASAP